MSSTFEQKVEQLKGRVLFTMHYDRKGKLCFQKYLVVDTVASNDHEYWRMSALDEAGHVDSFGRVFDARELDDLIQGYRIDRIWLMLDAQLQDREGV